MQNLCLAEGSPFIQNIWISESPSADKYHQYYCRYYLSVITLA